MAELKKLLSDSVVYGLSSIVGRFLNYLLVPVYTYHLSAASGGYGVVTNIYAHVALLLVLLTFGMETTYFYFVNRREAGQPDGWSHTVFGTALSAVGTVGLAFVVLVMALLGPVSAWLGYADHPDYVGVMAVVVALDAFQSICFARLRQEGRAWKFAALKLAFIVTNIALNLFVFLLAPKLSHLAWMSWYDEANNVGYIFYINLICTALVTLGFLPELRPRRGVRRFDRRLLGQMLAYTWPLLLLGIAGILNQVADKQLYPYLVPGPQGRVELGIYGACAKIAMIMAMITQAFRYAYEPFVFAGGRDAKSADTQAVVMQYFVQFTLLAFLAVVAYMDLLKYIIRSDYWGGLNAVPIVMMAEILMGVYFNLSFWYKLSGKTWWGAVISAVGCAGLVAVNVVFVPRVGYMACAWGGVAGYGVCVVMSYLLGRHYAPVPYPLKTIFVHFALAMGLFAIMQLWQPASLGWRLALNTLLLAFYAATLAASNRTLVTRALGKMKNLLKR